MSSYRKTRINVNTGQEEIVSDEEYLIELLLKLIDMLNKASETIQKISDKVGVAK